MKTILLALTASLAWAQTVGEIRGRVIESSLKLGIAGVNVTLSGSGVNLPTSTDSNGEFFFGSLRSASYTLTAAKEGYAAAPVTLVDVLPGATARVQIQMTQPGEMSGRVLGDDGEPLANYPVVITTLTPMPRRALRVTTSADASFSAAGLAPGRYVAFVAQKAGEREWIREQFTDEDAAAVDQDLEAGFWPGGGTLETVTPIPLTPGLAANFGTIRLRRATYYRARVTIAPNACRPGDPLHFSVWMEPAPAPWAGDARLLPHQPSDVSCRSQLLVGNLPSGRYRFALWSGELTSPGLWALATVDIGRGNVDVPMVLAAPVTVTGRVVGEDRRSIRIGLSPIAIDVPTANVEPDGAGNFVIQNVAWGRQDFHVFFRDPPRGRFVQAIRYGGEDVLNRTFLPATGVPAEIILAEGNGAISGSVTSQDQAARAVVMAIPWPASAPSQLFQFGAPTDQAGNFRMAEVAPGEYRVIAVPMSQPPLVETILRLAEMGARVVVERGATANVKVTFDEPVR